MATRIPARRTLAAAALLAASACARLQGSPTGRDGWLGYRVDAMGIELPADWTVRGEQDRLSAEAPDGRAQVRAEAVTTRFASEAECLSQAEQSLSRGAASLERSRRHPTRLGGRPAVVQEADRRGWHGWAWAACDGGRQYRLFFVGLSPLSPALSAVQRALEQSAAFGP